eukprot:CAMPEP_0172319088 /NCGR_PEP_ID=MMETSP1058-20130122/36761_1 /TAXON_ID=83371 /ORGANISM="Detonula confervacea, Strain CCMP 353" /LENGTH=935 /DNA_ID=CAMNT_0013034049 /DNA_START=147 /DNA_END=2950 /DNA_ORIENTATION=-
MVSTPENNNQEEEEEDNTHDHSDVATHLSHSSQLSLVSRQSSSQSQQSLQSQSHHNDNSRSRNNSDMSYSSIGNISHGKSQTSCFFADMTLDLEVAQMQTTPRTDMKFASMAVGSDGGNSTSREELMKSVPPMPLIEEPAAAMIGSDNHDQGGDDSMMPATTTAATTAAMSEQQSFARIDSTSSYPNSNNNNNQSSHTQLTSSSHNSSSIRPSRPPRRPRDVSWTAAALIFMPLGLFVPHLYYSHGYIQKHNHRSCIGGGDGDDHHYNEEGLEIYSGCTPIHPSFSQMALSSTTHSTILFSSLVATLISLALLKTLYSHPGGGEGNDQRHVNITRIFIAASKLCVWLNPILAMGIWTALPSVRWVVILPLGLLVRDVFRVRSQGSALPRTFRNNAAGIAGAASNNTMSSSSSHDRKTFFRALAIASLDILSRSLRRKSFVRAASLLLLLQFITVSLWWGALSVILSVEIFEEDGFMTKTMHALWLVLTLVSGKWATGTVARLLGFVAGGGVARWFDRQTCLVVERNSLEREVEMEEEERQRRQREVQQVQQEQQQLPSTTTTTTKALESSSEQGDAITEDSSHDGSSGNDDPNLASSGGGGYNSNYAAARAALHAMPEAYRTADASAYASAMDFDEGLNDDYEDDYDDDDVNDQELGQFRRIRSNENYSNNQPPTSINNNTTSVKSFLTAGCTISFGSVAQCGLLGGVAQFLWSFVRNMDAMGFFLQQRFSRSSNNSNDSGFRGMEISNGGSGGDGRRIIASDPRRWKETCACWYRRMDVSIRGFVRSHSDLAMSHVAAYFKSYQRAANDVAVLIETSGVESIIHDDITTHMCSSVGHLISGSIVLFFGMLLLTHQQTFASSASGSNSKLLADASLLEILLFSYMVCYTIIFTVLEPLRSAIKAVYVCFAEHPLSLSQAFPLIYQRLSRISEARR